MIIPRFGLISWGRNEGEPSRAGFANPRSWRYLSQGGSCRKVNHTGRWRMREAMLSESACSPSSSKVGLRGPPHSVVRR